MINLIAGKSMSQFFDVKPKKQNGQIQLNSVFSKRKQGIKIGSKGFSSIMTSCVTDKEDKQVFALLIEEFSKFMDPIVLPEPSIFKFTVTYYKIKPTQ